MDVLPQTINITEPTRFAFVYDARDIEIPLRDGTIIRGDVFRPAETENPVPALVAWSPYGKSGTGFFSLDIVPGRVGVSQDRLSGFESFEAPDPAEWTARGYPIVNINSRGAFDSQGDIRWFGSGEGRDGHDAIEHLATLPWCSGKIATIGNSWLAMAQWHIAAESPPHLTCIAPSEGCSDFYRETLCRGGVPYKPFWGFLAQYGLFGRNQQEDVLAMLEMYPLMNEYWEDKRAKMAQIQVPAYIVASYSTGLHTVGSFRGYEDIESKDKWLRVHPTQEWHDLYTTECIEELQHYFDHFLKGKDNAWEKTPRVRVSTLRYNQGPEYNHVVPDWPMLDTNYRTFFLSKDHALLEKPTAIPATLTYYRSYLIGYPKAVLYMSCSEHDDLDVFVQIRKADSDGNVLQNINIPLSELGLQASQVVTINTNKYVGPTGILRANHRHIDQLRSKPYWPLHSHDQEGEVVPGNVVKLEIGIWPTGIVFEQGEKLIFKIARHELRLAEFEPLRGAFTTGNKGRHIVHIGESHLSRVNVPYVEV
ncbi:hypothetical protein PV04_02112 [Phialophora macrospora]|uniref:Xaa-Pro dipeptidyl-peptidase C-terminal domain-containing protein n=1 Tax=Phialophora macrospora TaxID=1851006 RepID=A0A0D2GNU5_9EURO|nr:hypothetical protein PV04_02112 [Phialophora macrospora]